MSFAYKLGKYFMQEKLNKLNVWIDMFTGKRTKVEMSRILDSRIFINTNLINRFAHLRISTKHNKNQPDKLQALSLQTSRRGLVCEDI